LSSLATWVNALSRLSSFMPAAIWCRKNHEISNERQQFGRAARAVNNLPQGTRETGPFPCGCDKESASVTSHIAHIFLTKLTGSQPQLRCRLK
jgi:hypothetical protein